MSHHNRVHQLDPKEALVSGNVQFALMLYRQMAHEDPNKNILFSPFLIRMALIALYQGARGETQRQLKELTRLHLFRDLSKVPDALKEAMLTVPYGQTEYGYLYLANFLYSQDAETVEESFKVAAKGCHLEIFTNSGNLDEDKDKMNNRADQRTEHHVENLIEDDDMNALSSITLVSSFVFKGLWAFQFNPQETRLSWFYSHRGTKKFEVPMMRHKGYFRFGINDRPTSCRILELPMGEGGLCTIFILPKDLDGLPKLEQRLNADIIRILQYSINQTAITVVLPMIAFDISTSLVPYLNGQEATFPFEAEKADFSGAFGSKGPFVSNLRHRAIFKVSEGGKSDPLPSVIIGKTMVEEYFVADHPFLFVLKDNKSDLIHLVGRYQCPPEHL